MPTVLERDGFRFFFYSADRNEPPHVHVRKGCREAKFWLDPIRPARLGRLKQNDLRQVIAILEENEQQTLERWYEQFNG